MDISMVNVHNPNSLTTTISFDHALIYNKMKMCLRHISSKEFPADWEKNILKLLPKKYRKRYSSLMDILLKEAKDIYVKDMQNFVCKIVLTNPRENVDSSVINNINYKFLDEKQTDNYNTFTKHCKLLKKKYFLFLEPIKVIMNSVQLKLPAVICNFKYYHNFGLMSLNDFQNLINNDIKKGSLAITNHFYTDVSRTIAESKILKNINGRKLLNIMQCITHVFVQQILNVMIKSIDHILNSMDDGHYCPQIKFQLLMQDNQLLLSPSIKEVYSMYHCIIEKIGAITQNLIPLEEWLNIKRHFRYIKIKLPDWYIKESHNRLEVILCNLFQSINEHVAKITEEFYCICAPSLKEKILSLTSGEINVDLYLKHIQEYNTYLIKVNAMVMNTYHVVGKLEQHAAKEILKKESYDIINIFVNKLIKYHHDYNLSICLEFEDLKTKALNIPNNAKDLIELIDYISHASQELITELECKIEKSVHMLGILSETTLLSEDHIQLNRKTINWLSEIEPVFKQSNVLCEAMKNELEEDMQRRINQLNLDVDDIIPQLSVLDIMDDINNIREYVEYYKKLLKRVNQINHEMQRINEEENLFKFPETEFPNVIELHEIIISFYDLIYIIYQWQKDNLVWLDGPFEWLDAAVIEKKTLNYFEKITEMSKTFRAKIKMDVIANKCFKFSGIADDPDPMQQPVPLKLCWQALNDINDFKKYLRLVICMCNPALQKRHWVEMSAICNFDLTPNAGTSLRKIIAFDLMTDIEKYEAISIGANRELELQQKLIKMMKEWDQISFEISFDEKTNMYVFSNSSNIELLLEHHLIIIEEMKTSNFVKQIFSMMTDFFTSLFRIREIINQWDYIQVLILSLNPAFHHSSIEVHLVKEFILYKEITETLKNIKNQLLQNPTFVNINNTAILESLLDIAAKLEHISQSLKNYIETKRVCFPRFYFLSDTEVQEILYEFYNFKKSHVSIQKCFEGIQKVKTNEQKCVCSIIGDCEEELHLEKFISFSVESNSEEKWLICLEEEINTVIKKNIFQCYEIFNQTFTYNSILNFPSMVIVCTLQLYWTSEVHKCLASLNFEALNSLYLKYISHLNNLISELKNYSIKRWRNLLMSLIIIINHQKDIIKLLLDNNITNITDFEWVAQLRYYIEKDNVKVSIFNATIKYGYEYSYYKQCIINTPLTDRCYHILMQAYKYHLYGALIGPSSTGKSETIKSLAKAMAILFRNFNCACISSYNFLSQIFKGFISSGAWLCFENFDRLEMDLLSKLTQTLTNIFQTIATNLKITTFEGSLLKINSPGHICIVTKLGLFKNSNLPDNLKSLFRTVCMVVPDLKRIVEIELFAAGLSNSKLIASKLITFYKILSKQILCEVCNMFNLHSAKAITKTIIYLKQSFPCENETVLLLRSLIDIHLPKFCDTDVHIFKNVIHCMFPDVELLPSNYIIFLETLETICKSRSISIHDVFKLKIIQIFELMYVYQSLVLVGNPFVGKTEILNVLKLVLSSLYEKGIEFGVNVKLETIVPSTIDVDYLFGYLDVKSNIWKDGICSKIFRSFLENDSSDKKWVIFDGPLNNAWLENLYTVLNTNKVLHLTSGEKLHMTNSVSIIFETLNMEDVSPAILSNCGIVYIESSSIDWKSYVTTHFSKNNIYNEYEEIHVLFIWAMEASLQFIQKHCTLTLTVGQLHCVMSTLNLFEIYLTDVLTENGEEKGKMNIFLVWIQVVLILSIVWGLGGNLDADSHIKFNSFCISLWSGTNKEYPKPDVIKNVEVTLPHEGLIQDHFYVFKGVGNWKYWGGADILKNEQILEIPDCNEIFVPTIDTMKYNHILLKHIKHRKPFIICGNASTGKTSLIKNLLKNKLTNEMYFNMFNFISLTTVVRTQKLLLSKLNKIKKRHYGASKHQFCINFIEDLNIQRYECKSEINSVLELFRQYHNYGYFYGIDEPEKVFIHDIMFLLSIIVNAATEICPRFLKHFNLYTIYVPSADTIFRIFSNILFSNLKKNSFTADVFSTVTSITNATIDVYNSVIKILLPIPAKFQYQFNIRDISKVISGCSLLQKDSVETKVTFIRLWAHEIWRVFGDRILDHNDKEWLFLQIKNTSKCHFKDSFETVFDYLPKFDNNKITKGSFNNLMFSNFMNAEKNEIKAYEEICSNEKLKNKILFYLNEYNNNNIKKRIDLVISQYILESLIKISRILAIPGGNLLMISHIGSGRKSLTILAAYMQKQELFEPSVYSYCDLNIWRKDLKTVLKKCGGSGENSILFLKDKQMKDNFFDDISSLLATGEIPDLFSTEEKCDIIEIVRLHAQGGNKNEEISNHAVINYFLAQCKDKLHIIISCTTTNIAIRSYLSKYSELVKYCTINWYEMWPTDTLTQIGIKYFQNINVKENIKMNIITVCIKLHNSMQEVSTKYYKETGTKNHVTLSAFLHMLKLYTYLLCKKEKDILTIRNRYLTGLEKLDLAAQQVKKMKGTLTILKPQLELSAQKTINTMKEVENENIRVEKATVLVQQEEEIANKKAEIAGRLKMECEADLAVAIPILEDAVAALNTLKPTDITLVKAMKNPPDTVKLVMAAICVMLDIAPDKTIDSVTGKKYTDYWSPSKRILSDMNFLQILKDYDKDNIPSNIIQVIKKTYITDNNFKPYIVAKASSAAEGLCKWVCAMVSYDEVAKAVAPKKEKLYIAQKECNEAEAFLNEKRKTLSALNAKLAILNKSLQETLQQKIKLEQEVEDCTNKLYKAESLMTSLGGEKNRWIEFSENLKTSYDNLYGDIILTCGIISYISPYNILFRDKILEQWKQYIEDIKIPYSTNYDLINVLGEENDINYWYLSGLPKNGFSVENAIIMNNSKLWSLFIDSQNQANQWIKIIEKNNNLKVIKLTDLDFISVIQYNIENGIPTLIENVGEELGTLLDPFLLKRMFDNEEYLDNNYDIKYSLDFRLYITTRLINPEFICEVFSKLTIINFSIPNEAFQDKLLDFIIFKEKPELQEKFETLLIEDVSNKKILKQQEDIILSILSSTTTNILEDENAVKSLDSSKSLSSNIIKKQEFTKTVSLEVDKYRNSYIQFVKYCVDLFDALTPLSYVNHMYRFSFSWFMQLYKKSIETSNRSTNLEKRLKYLKSSFIKNLHSNISRSLSEKHRILYSFLLCSKILLNEQQATEEEIKYFVTPNQNHIDPILNYTCNWLPYNIWINISDLSKIFSAFCDLANDICSNEEAWKQYYTSEPLQDHLMPEPWITKLSLFQKLILVKVLHPDKIIAQIMQMVKNVLGTMDNQSPKMKISQSYAESTYFTPILFILPTCLSPLSLISTFAKNKGYLSRFISLSMNKDEEKKAEHLIEEAQKEGSWVFLENCHLVPHWMVQLENICENCNNSNIHPDFRLWLSSYSFKEFPISILQNCIKIMHDYPLNIKDALLSIYQSEPIINTEFLEACPGKNNIFLKLLFGICFFHVVVRERKNFGIQGWNVPYDFDYTDLQISIMQLQTFIDNTDHVPFNILLYFIGECNYGGKVGYKFDEKCLKHLLNDYCNPNIIENRHYTHVNNIEMLIPQRCEYHYIINHIKKIPLELSPEIFGSNKNGVFIRNTRMITKFLLLFSNMNTIAILSLDEELYQDQVLILINDINNKLCDSIQIDEISDKCTSVPENPLERVLFCEVKSLKQILKVTNKTLNNLKLALNGYRPLTKSLKELAKEIYENKIPHVWKKTHPIIITGNLSYYIDNLLKRINFIINWTNHGCPKTIWFETLFHYKMFFSAILLTFSEKYNIPIEEIGFRFEIATEETVTINDTDTYSIYGLHLCGARWNFEANILTENFTTETWQNMPPIYLKCSQNKEDTEKVYECPLYIAAVQHIDKDITFFSKNYIITIPLKTDVPQSQLIKCGTALFCHKT